MLELEYKRKLVAALRVLGWEVQEHEDKISNYIPDLSFSAHGKKGWIEVKYLPRVPTGGLSKIRHYTAGQRDFLIDHGNAGGGLCFLLVGEDTGGHHVWRHDSLRNAEAGTYVAALSLRCASSDMPGRKVYGIAECLDALVAANK